MSIKADIYKVDFEYKNDVQKFDLILHLYSKTELKKELSERELIVLREYILNGYSTKTKDGICLTLQIKKGNLNAINCNLQKKGFLKPHPTTQKLKVLEEKLNFLKEMFLDTPGNRKIFLVNFGF